MSPKLPLSEDEEPDNFDEMDCEGGFSDEADDDTPEYEWDYFYEFDEPE